MARRLWESGHDAAAIADCFGQPGRPEEDSAMVHVLIQPGTGGQEAQAMRSIEYDTVSDRYGKYLLDEVLSDVEKTYKIRKDGYSRAIAGRPREQSAR